MTISLSRQARNRLVIVVIALLCIVPFGVAWYLAKNPGLVGGRDKSNYGHLIAPAQSFEYADFFGKPVSTAENLQEIKGHWVLVQVAPATGCADVCRDTLHKTGQLRLMLNKELTRVRRLLLVPGNLEAGSLQDLLAADPTLLAAGLSDPLRDRLRMAVGGDLADGLVLLMDPFANVMMWYAPGFDPYGALRDLQRLLRISQIG